MHQKIIGVNGLQTKEKKVTIRTLLTTTIIVLVLQMIQKKMTQKMNITQDGVRIQALLHLVRMMKK
jgi:hypothetical protein